MNLLNIHKYPKYQLDHKMSSINPRVVGGLVILGVLGYIVYKFYQSGYDKGVQLTTQKYEQRIQIKDNKIQELQALIDQLQQEIVKLKKPKDK